MKQNLKKLLVALVFVIGCISPFVCSYADNNIKLDITVKNKWNEDGILLFYDVDKLFNLDIHKDNLPAGYDIEARRTKITTNSDSEFTPYTVRIYEDNSYTWEETYYKPDSKYKFKYVFMLEKNDNQIDWDEDISASDVTINGINATNTDAFSEMGIESVTVTREPDYIDGSHYELVVEMIYEKTPKIGYEYPRYKFDKRGSGGYISGGQQEDELIIEADVVYHSVMQNIFDWYNDYADDYDIIFFGEEGSLIRYSWYLHEIADNIDKRIHLPKSSLSPTGGRNFSFMFYGSNVTGYIDFDINKATDMTGAFYGTRLKEIKLSNGNNVRANRMLGNIRTLERLEFKGLKNLSIEPNTFVGDYVVKDRTANTTEYKKQDEKYDFIDNHDYLVELGSDDGKTDINTLSITTPESVRYTGEAIEPEVIVTDGDTVLVEGEAYTVVYKDNVEVGTMTTEVTGIGDYVGTATRSTQIVKIYPGGKPSFTPITSAGKTLADAKLSTGSINVEGTIAWEKPVGTIVEKDVSYKWIFTPNNTAFYKAKYGVLTPYSNNIAQKDISTLTFSSIDDVSYTGQAMMPEVVVKDSGNTLVKDESYTVSYENNVNVGTAKIIIRGAGNYNGTKELAFKIVKAMPLGLPSFTLIKEDGKKLSDASIQLGTINAVGTVKWQKPLSTTVEKAKAYKWVFTPTDINNYEKLTGEFVVYPEGENQVQRMPHIGIHSDNYFESIKNKVSYKDSKDSDWFYPYVNYVTNRQIMNGTGNGMFSPKSRITKAMLVTMLFRLSEDENVTVNNVWVDLKDGKWYTEAAKWAETRTVHI